MTNLVNIILFQVGWFAAVLGGANNTPLMGTLLVALIVSLHVGRSPRSGAEAWLVAITVGIGAVFESMLASSGWVVFTSGQLLPGTAPYWMVAMWALFATTLNVSLRWLKGRRTLAAVLGAIGGPLAYFAGARLGALEFIRLDASLAAIALAWALLLPALLVIAGRFDGWAEGRTGPVSLRPLLEE